MQFHVLLTTKKAPLLLDNTVGVRLPRFWTLTLEMTSMLGVHEKGQLPQQSAPLVILLKFSVSEIH